MGGSKNGQPADIIAVRNEHAYLIDAKDARMTDLYLAELKIIKIWL